MKLISISSWFGFPISMDERFKLIKAAGFNGILLWWSDEFAEVDGNKFLHPDLVRKNNLFIENIHTPYNGINCLWTESIDGDDFERILTDSIDECSRFEISTAVVHICQGYNPPPVNQIGLNRIKRLVEIAERKNINLALENLRRPDYLDFVFANIQSNKLGFCFDSGHENCYTKGTDLLSKYGSKLMALHLHDNDGTDDQHLRPGEGIIDWDVIIKKLKETRYSGTIALEVINQFSYSSENKNPLMFLNKAFMAAERLCKLEESSVM